MQRTKCLVRLSNTNEVGVHIDITAPLGTINAVLGRMRAGSIRARGVLNIANVST